MSMSDTYVPIPQGHNDGIYVPTPRGVESTTIAVRSEE
jgi:hypothetical protein